MKSFTLEYKTSGAIEFTDSKFNQNDFGEQELVEMLKELTSKYPDDLDVGIFVGKTIELVRTNKILSFNFDEAVSELVNKREEFLPHVAKYVSASRKLFLDKDKYPRSEEDEELAFELFRIAIARWSTDQYYKQFVKLSTYMYDKKDLASALSIKHDVDRRVKAGDIEMIKMIECAKNTISAKAS